MENGGAFLVPLRPKRDVAQRKQWLVSAFGVTLLVVAGIAFSRARGTSRPAHAAAGASIIVLPFTNVGGDSTQDYFADGMTDELIGALTKLQGLRVVSRTVSFSYKGKPLEPARVARDADVGYALSGSVRRVANRLRVTVEVTRADSTVPWSNTFDRTQQDVFTVQEDIAHATASALGQTLIAGLDAHFARRGTGNAEAYDKYLKGRFFWSARSEDGIRRAIDNYNQALAIDPSYTRALSGLADAYAVGAWYSYFSPADGYGNAKKFALRALTLDSTLAEPYASLGYVAQYYDWDFSRADTLYRHAIALDSTYATAHQWYGNLLITRGEPARAVAEFEAAARLDPLNRISVGAVCWGQYMARRYADASAQCQRALELDPTLWAAHMWAGQAREMTKDEAGAMSALNAALELSHGAAAPLAARAHALATFGHAKNARLAVAALEQTPRSYVPSYEIAAIYAALGDADRAIALLERAFRERSHSVVFLRVDPALDRVAKDPRLAKLADQIRLP